MNFNPDFNCPTHFGGGDPTCPACISKQPQPLFPDESEATPTPRTDAFCAPLRGLGTGYYEALDFARQLERELAAAEAGAAVMREAADMLWSTIANVSGGAWEQQSAEWQEAAVRWRDGYFAALNALQQPTIA